MTNKELIHYGILGMKWGRRKGKSSVPAVRVNPHSKWDKTKKKPVTTEDMKARIREESVRKQYEKIAKKPGKLDIAKSKVDAGSDIVNIGRNINNPQKKKGPPKLLDTSHLSDVELQKKIQRMNMERQYAQLMEKPEEISIGKERVNKALDIAGATLATAGTVLTIAMAVKELRK